MSEIERWTLVASVLLLYGLLCLICVRRYQSQLPEAAERTVTEAAVLVAWASQSGRAMELARQTAAALPGPVQLLPLAQVKERQLAGVRRALFVVSTYGDGEPPDGGIAFARCYLTNRSRRGGALDLSALQFSVLALGDRRYSRFCGFGHRLHDGLGRLGAKPLSAPLELDAADAGHSAHIWQQWLQQWRGDASATAAPATPTLFKQPPILFQHPVLHWTLMDRMQLNPGSPGEPLYWLRLQPPGGAVCDWRAGDLVEVELSAPPVQPPREYTIASLASDPCLELLVRRQRREDGTPGLASGWLTGDLAVGDTVALRLRNNPLFWAPAPPVPLVLIGNGSGFAGLRALLREREQMGGRDNWLLFGERCPQTDCLFADEIEGWQQRGLLPRLNRAFSRCTLNPTYVQDCLHTEAESLRDWLADGAVIMVCGSRVGMAAGVDVALRSLLGDAAVEQLLIEDRYRRDVY